MNLLLYESITLRIYSFTNLLPYESIPLRIYYFTNLLLYESITLRIYFTNLFLYESITLRIYLLLYESIILRIYYWAFLKVRNSEVSHPNFLWQLFTSGTWAVYILSLQKFALYTPFWVRSTSLLLKLSCKQLFTFETWAVYYIHLNTLCAF